MRKVNLRNSNGQFCTLEQFCSERPTARVVSHNLSESGKYLDKNRENLLKIKQLAEVISAFGLKRGHFSYQKNSISSGICEISIDSNGTWSGTYKSSTGQDNIENFPFFAEEILKEEEEKAARWQATSYEIES